MSTLFICPTPIGNLEDISERVLRTLASVEVIYCEDTRRAKKLIDNFSITTPLKSYFVGNEVSKVSEIEETLTKGINVALISDAGTPLISDPGNILIQKLIQKNYNIVSIPGPSSVLTALTVSGFELNEFQFLGFVPKAGKEKEEFVIKLLNSKMASVCFTSPKRIKKDLKEFVNLKLENEIVVCREMTKKFETIYRGDAETLLSDLKDIDIKGEITLVISKSEKIIDLDLDILKAVEGMISFDIPKREIAKAVSNITEYSVNEIYDRIKDL